MIVDRIRLQTWNHLDKSTRVVFILNTVLFVVASVDVLLFLALFI